MRGDRWFRWHGLAFGLGLISSGVTAASTGCIFKDSCTVVISQGGNWCSNILNAQMWPSGHPELAEEVKNGEDRPIGCACFNDAEEEILAAHVPLAKYLEFFDQIATAARDDCDYYVPPGWDHNCYEEGPDGPVVSTPLYTNAGDCVGDCTYINIPKDGCGDDPSPYECEVMYGDGGETDGGDDSTTGIGLGDVPREVQWR